MVAFWAAFVAIILFVMRAYNLISAPSETLIYETTSYRNERAVYRALVLFGGLTFLGGMLYFYLLEMITWTPSQNTIVICGIVFIIVNALRYIGILAENSEKKFKRLKDNWFFIYCSFLLPLTIGIYVNQIWLFLSLLILIDGLIIILSVIKIKNKGIFYRILYSIRCIDRKIAQKDKRLSIILFALHTFTMTCLASVVGTLVYNHSLFSTEATWTLTFFLAISIVSVFSSVIDRVTVKSKEVTQNTLFYQGSNFDILYMLSFYSTNVMMMAPYIRKNPITREYEHYPDGEEKKKNTACLPSSALTTFVKIQNPIE